MHRAKGVVLLEAHLQEELKTDPEHSGWHRLTADDFGKVLTVQRRWVVGIGHGHKEAHAHFIALLAGMEKNAAPGNAHGTAEVIEVILFGV